MYRIEDWLRWLDEIFNKDHFLGFRSEMMNFKDLGLCKKGDEYMFVFLYPVLATTVLFPSRLYCNLF